jgi:hypothetical protein
MMFTIGVLAERRQPAQSLAGPSWQVAGVLTEPPPHDPWTEIRRDGDDVLFYAGTSVLEFHKSETGNYRDNLATGAPRLWIVLRPTDRDPGMELALVTADPDEGESMTGAGDLVVEALAMPQQIADALAAFVAEHHVERPFIKRSRS